VVVGQQDLDRKPNVCSNRRSAPPFPDTAKI
jgi:hypothetical protein